MQPMPSPDAFIPLDRLDRVDELVERSFAAPIVIFKHSRTCGTSAYAYDELVTYRQQPTALEIHLVDVLRGREISRALATRFKVHHESPQVLLLVDGSVRWHASHYSITADALQQALAIGVPMNS